MILVDSSVWVDHFRAGEPNLVKMLEQGSALVHPFVIGELALGTLRNRTSILSLLHDLPIAPVATDEEALIFLEIYRLHGLGISTTSTSISRHPSPYPGKTGSGRRTIVWRRAPKPCVSTWPPDKSLYSS